ncbi:hypothetical protein BDQ17DRAFT_1434077 [Cyathus striatus]|nr:hypothetical protein BDQ17DRAFT_1434077 [Cyathus striatus]
MEEGRELPYYHPSVSHLAFRFIPCPSSPPSPTSSPFSTPFPSPSLLRIETIPLQNTPTDPSSRLAPTALSLLDTLHRYGWGILTGYKKRVKHDVLVPRERYQDLYVVLRERWGYLVGGWREVTDPRKHVLEDIGIATYLMLLWKDTFSSPGHQEQGEYDYTGGKTPCGNGLLTHSRYSEESQARLKIVAVDPTVIPSTYPFHYDDTTSPKDPNQLQTYLTKDSWMISNHADKLTPWTPLLTVLYGYARYITIPCYPWSFDAKFDRAQVRESLRSANSDDEDVVEDLVNQTIGEARGIKIEDAQRRKEEEELGLSGRGEKSAYATYRLWLARLSAYCGWLVEADTLRILSTRNWGVVGRRRGKVPPEEALENVLGIIRNVNE